MKRVGFLLLIPLPLFAHAVSMSTGELHVDGSKVVYELRMPLYEIPHIHDPAHSLLASLRFSSAGIDGKVTEQRCGANDGVYDCLAVYQFPALVERLHVQCALPSVTVPNHVHVLRAYLGNKSDEAVFDLTFTTADLRFRPPTPFEIAARQWIDGFLRASDSAAPLLFLLAIALAARNWKERLSLALAYLAAETLACVVMPFSPGPVSPRFVEAAAALSVSYLAFEILLAPAGKHRWAAVAFVGLFHGAWISFFLRESGYPAPVFLSGAFAAQLLVLAILGFLFSRKRLQPALPKSLPAAAALLLGTGLWWFFTRLAS